MSVSGTSESNIAATHRWIELISTPSLLCDQAAVIQGANRRARGYFGIIESQISNITVEQLISATSRDDYRVRWDTRTLPVRPRVPGQPPLSVLRADGISASARMSIAELKTDVPTLFLLVFTHPSISNANTSQDENNLAQHLSSIRHQIRNPLSGIKVITDVLLHNRAGNLGKKQIGHLEAIRDAAVQMSTLISEIDVPEKMTVDQDVSELARLQPDCADVSRSSG